LFTIPDYDTPMASIETRIQEHNMNARMLLCSMTFLSLAAGSVALAQGNSKVHDRSGYVLGWGSTGSYVVRLADQRCFHLMQSGDGHHWTQPFWDQHRSQLICIDEHCQTIVRKVAFDAEPEVIFQEEGAVIRELSVSRQHILAIVDQAKISRLVAIDTGSYAARVVAEIPSDMSRLFWRHFDLTDSGVILMSEQVQDGDRKVRVVYRVREDDGALEELCRLNVDKVTFWMSPDGNSLLLWTGEFQVVHLSDDVLRPVPSKKLPRRFGPTSLCFTSNTTLLMWQSQGPALHPLLVAPAYELNIETGEVSKMRMPKGPYTMRYLTECPFEADKR
jgi:hypothetical protein